MQAMHPAAAAAAAAALALAGGCSPALDWREVRADGVELLMPCRPQARTRDVVLAGRTRPMTLRVCDAAGRTWAIASADVGEPPAVGPALAALREAAAANVGAASGVVRPIAVRGASTQFPAARVAFEGRRGDGRPVPAEVAFFARGTLVYQATVLGDGRDGAADTFFGSLRAAPR